MCILDFLKGSSSYLTTLPSRFVLNHKKLSKIPEWQNYKNKTPKQTKRYKTKAKERHLL